jgi:hypothetical protein
VSPALPVCGRVSAAAALERRSKRGRRVVQTPVADENAISNLNRR